ncbi:MAG: efflux RND transporter periplasmic adaptor subunit [Microbacteriaceae bacterium]
MNIARTWIFPILRILLLAMVAVALVKFAFFPDVVKDDSPEKPTAEIVEPQVTVTIGTVQNDVSLTGTVAANPAVPIAATFTGEVRQVKVKLGSVVKKGQVIVVVRGEVPKADGTTFTKTVNVVAPTAGTVSALTALVGQGFSVGDPVGQIAPPSFNVSGSIPPEQLYKLLAQPKTAEVTINGGPAPFTCTGLNISSPLEGQEAGSGDGGPTVRCSVPANVRVFPGLSADIVIAGGIAADVLTVPMTAVEGTAETGNVYFVLEDGTTEVRAVTLGLNDGIFVEITDGLEEGDTILQFVPGALGGEGDGDGGVIVEPGIGGEECVEDQDGNVVCSGFER